MTRKAMYMYSLQATEIFIDQILEYENGQPSASLKV